LDRARLAVLTGDFVAAEGNLHDLERMIRDDSMASAHARPARMLVELYDETDRARAAIATANDYLKRGAAWSTPPLVSEGSIADDPVPPMLGALAHGGAISPSEFAAKQSEWVALWRAKTSGVYTNYLWVYGYAETVESREEAARALDAAQPFLPLPAFTPRPTAQGLIGKVYLRAGRVDEALPFLRTSAAACTALADPFGHTRALFDLGRALEAKADKDGACAAYRPLLARWGAAKPKSLTAERAKARAKALACQP
jgi:serine/threonine-protein kinase